MDALVASGQVTALIYYRQGTRHRDPSRELPGGWCNRCLERSVTRLIIESREGRDDLDRQVLISQLRQHREMAFGYGYMPPHGDPLLWVADALAWCSSAGGTWR